MADERKALGKDPVVNTEQFRANVQREMLDRFGRPFRDIAEMNQAVAFLHENGTHLSCGYR